jgi:hypothetical protein
MMMRDRMKRNARRNPAGVRNSFSLRLLKMRSMRGALPEEKQSAPVLPPLFPASPRRRRRSWKALPVVEVYRQIVSDVKGI